MPLVANWLAKYKTRVEGMLGGIDYYPKRKKRIKFKIFLFIFYQTPSFFIEAQGSLISKLPSCKISIEILSGDLTNAI